MYVSLHHFVVESVIPIFRASLPSHEAVRGFIMDWSWFWEYYPRFLLGFLVDGSIIAIVFDHWVFTIYSDRFSPSNGSQILINFSERFLYDSQGHSLINSALVNLLRLRFAVPPI